MGGAVYGRGPDAQRAAGFLNGELDSAPWWQARQVSVSKSAAQALPSHSMKLASSFMPAS